MLKGKAAIKAQIGRHIKPSKFLVLCAGLFQSDQNPGRSCKALLFAFAAYELQSGNLGNRYFPLHRLQAPEEKQIAAHTSCQAGIEVLLAMCKSVALATGRAAENSAPAQLQLRWPLK